MIVYLLLKLFDTLVTFVFGLVPVFETPAWLVTNLPDIFTMIFSFNQYLPIYETVVAVVFLIGFHIQYKILNIVLNKVGVSI
jgi:hypothetical protein